MIREIENKITRLKAGGKPRVLDLFAGCGGLSLGFQAAGFEVVAAVENDPHAARSHGLNFHGGAGCAVPGIHRPVQAAEGLPVRYRIAQEQLR